MSTQQNTSSVGQQPASSTPPPTTQSTSLSQFQQGMSGLTTAALLEVMRIYMQISNLYGNLFVSQMGVQSEVADDLGEYSKQLGIDQQKEMESQAWSSIASGLVTVGMAGATMAQDWWQGNGNLDEQIKGAKSYQKAINERVDPTLKLSAENEMQAPVAREDIPEDAMKERLQSLKQRDNFVDKNGKAIDVEKSDDASVQIDKTTIRQTDENELSGLKETYDKKISDFEAKRSANASDKMSRYRTRLELAQALGTISTGTGSIYAGQAKYDEGVDDANKNVTQAALSTEQGVVSSYRNNSDTYISQSKGVTQVIAAISRANSLGG